MMLKTVRLSVAGVALDDETDAPTVLLRCETGTAVLSVPVGAFEASAIIIEVEGLKPPRPLTHDLFAQLFARHAFRLLSFELYARGEDGYLGRLRYRKGFRTYFMEVRPSDGIALALRLGAPIEAAEDLVEIVSSPQMSLDPSALSTESVLLLDSRSCSIRA
jgi:bifunctional DNase/RNase